MSDILMFIFTVVLPVLFIVLSLMLICIKLLDLDDDKIKNLFRTVNRIQKDENPLKRNTLDD